MVVIELLEKSGLVSNLIIGFLIFLSLISWAIIFVKFFRCQSEINRLSQHHRIVQVEQDLKSLFLQIKAKKPSSLTHCITRLLSIPNTNILSQPDAAQEFFDRSIDTELFKQQRGLGSLSLISQLAPFLGLLGTVWGIMNAFYSISLQKSAQISVVAPGIAEALVTTVIGLLVAIPATIGFFIFTHKAKKIEFLLENSTSSITHLIRSSQKSSQETSDSI